MLVVQEEEEKEVEEATVSESGTFWLRVVIVMMVYLVHYGGERESIKYANEADGEMEIGWANDKTPSNGLRAGARELCTVDVIVTVGYDD